MDMPLTFPALTAERMRALAGYDRELAMRVINDLIASGRKDDEAVDTIRFLSAHAATL